MLKKHIFTLILCLFIANESLYLTLIDELLVPGWRNVLSIVLMVIFIVLFIINLYIHLSEYNEKKSPVFAWLPIAIPFIIFALFSFFVPAVATEKAPLVKSGTQLYVNEDYSEYILLTDQNELLFIYFEDDSKDLECCVYLKTVDTTKGANILGFACHDYGYVGDQIYIKSDLIPYAGRIYDPDFSMNEYGRFIMHPDTKIIPLEEFNSYDYNFDNFSYSRNEEFLYKNKFFMLKDSESLMFQFCDSLSDVKWIHNMENYSRVYDQNLIERFSKGLDILWRVQYTPPERAQIT